MVLADGKLKTEIPDRSRGNKPWAKREEKKMKDDNNLLIGIIITVAVFLFFGLFGFGGMMGSGYGMMGGFGLGSMWIFGFLFMTLILVALVLFILWLIKQLQNDKK